MAKNLGTLLLIGIIVLAFFLRLYRYDFHDVINDEVFYGFRSIGLIDTINSPYQPTPWEWFDPVPGWAKLSFHDHPPFGFYLQHLFFKIFGNNLLGLRLPVVISGVLSVYLVYLIGRRLFQDARAGLLAAAILATNSYHVWISRVAMQESLVIFFMLLGIYLFLRTLEESRFFYWTVIILGLAILTKYTAVILLPTFLIYLLWKRRDLLTTRRTILSAMVLLIILSPVIIYNLKLYQARGHSDFQLSYLLKQDVPEWQARPGREVGSWVDKFQNLFQNYWRYAGPVFSALTLLSFLGWLKFRRQAGFQFLGLSVFSLVLLFLVIGPQERFLVMLTPFVALLFAAAVFLSRGRWRGGLILILILLELAYLINTYYLVNPRGRLIWHYSQLRYDQNIWGYNQLEDYLQKKMSGIYPERVFKLKYEFANQIQDQAIKKAQKQGRNPKPILFITDTSMHGLASLWYVHRHVVYDGWPMINTALYQEWLTKDPNYFQNQGFKDLVFIKAGETLLRLDDEGRQAIALENQLQQAGHSPVLIRNPQSKIAFRVYEFQ